MREGGLIRLYTLEDVAENGLMPSEKLVFKCEYYYSKIVTGVTRRYAALGANRDFNAVIRCWNYEPEAVEGVKFAKDEEGIQYRIDVAEPAYDSDAIDLTLVRLEEFYDVADETPNIVQPVVST